MVRIVCRVGSQFHKPSLGIALAICLTACVPARAQDAFPPLLPPAELFRLTLSEHSKSTLPLGPSCSGEAAVTLTCRAFALKLQNLSSQTVRLGNDCREPHLTIERKEPHSSSGWWPTSQPIGCRPPEWNNIRLKPGESTVLETRLISPGRYAEALLPGAYILHANLVLFGCAESADGGDCLAPLEATPQPPSTAYGINFQKPIIVVSNEIQAESPKLPDLGKMSFGFDVGISSGVPSNPNLIKGCTSENKNDVDCIVFKYRIVNSGTRAVRYATMSCSDSAIGIEYRDESGKWINLPPVFWSCTRNIYIETPILPGQAVESEFTLRSLVPPRDRTSLRVPGEHWIRFRFYPNACSASPDGRFCLTSMTPQESVVSSALTISSQ